MNNGMRTAFLFLEHEHEHTKILFVFVFRILRNWVLFVFHLFWRLHIFNSKHEHEQSESVLFGFLRSLIFDSEQNTVEG